MSWFFAVWVGLIGLFSPAYAVDTKGAEDNLKSKKAEEAAKEMTEAEKEAEKKKKEKVARVVVLKWAGVKATDYTDTTVQRIVRSVIARPDAQFYPEVDLYQNGRKVKDKTVVPAMQPATVPVQNIARVRQAVDEISGVPWNALQPDQWGLKAGEMRDLTENIWFVERVELREPLFLLYAQIGRAADSQNQNIPPFYEQIGAQAVNYYFYLAATLAFQDPALMNKLTDQELNANVGFILQQLQQGAYPTLRIDFQQEGQDFDAETFNKSYEIYLNGIVTEPNDRGQMEIFLGRTDIYLKRKDSGHGLSERLEVTKLEDGIQFVWDTARKKMGVDFINQLFLHPNECTPALDGDILTYLAIYAKIHEKAEIYIAVPEDGNPNKTKVWRYDRPSATLQLVGGGDDGFPVRFAILGSVGIMYSGMQPSVDTSVTTVEDPTTFDPQSEALSRGDVALASGYVPIDLELRGHYNRLMVNVGVEPGFNTAGTFTERYWMHGNEDGSAIIDESAVVNDGLGTGTYRPFDPETDGDAKVKNVGTPVYNEALINRNVYMGISAVLGRDAGMGFGPHLGARVGWDNLPHGLQTTAHAGWTFQPPILKASKNGRVHLLIDVDLRGGVVWPFSNSVWHTTNKLGINAMPVFGLTAGAGVTF